MKLWNEWLKQVILLKSSCNNYITFFWLLAILIAFSVRSDIAGVTSFVRCLELKPFAYFCLLHFFHSSGIDLENLTHLWIRACLSIFKSTLCRKGNHYVVIADSLIRPKEGHKMPAVKALHQSSASNSKASFVMGHFFECLSFLVVPLIGQAHAIPITARIHDGIILTDEDKTLTIIDRFYMLVSRLLSFINFLVVADAYYYAKKTMIALKSSNNYLITRMRTNAVVWEPYQGKKRKTGKGGRHRLYGKKLVLRRLFRSIEKSFITDYSPVYGESKVRIKYRVIDAVVRPGAFRVRIVLVVHPTRGKVVLLSTNTELPALEIIRIYGFRFKIEVAFKSAIHQVGVYAYHFWLQVMEKIKKGSGTQDLSNADKKYKEKVISKINAYLLYVQLGLIAQGLLKYLAIYFKDTVWELYDSWMRTMKKTNHPSEWVVMHVLNSYKHRFIGKFYFEQISKKFFTKHFLTDQTATQKFIEI